MRKRNFSLEKQGAAYHSRHKLLHEGNRVVESLGDLIARLRAEQGLTLRQLAKASGVGSSSIHKIENGIIVNPTRSTLERLARALRVPYDSLEGLLRQTAKPVAVNNLGEAETTLFTAIRALPIPGPARDTLLGIVRIYMRQFHQADHGT